MLLEIPRIFIGYDKEERIAAYVLAHSIQRNASRPVSITFLNRKSIPWFTRRRNELESTDFSISRFCVPYACKYFGRAIFIDCDMLVLGDICTAWDNIDWSFAVSVVQHEPYTPKEEIKFLGNIQTDYPFKNWSSFMAFNCCKCTSLSLDKLNNPYEYPGLYFHQFKWLDGENDPTPLIGRISKEWNVLVGVHEVTDSAKNLHFTSGAPYFAQYKHCEMASLWFEECKDMLYANTGFIHELLAEA